MPKKGKKKDKDKEKKKKDKDNEEEKKEVKDEGWVKIRFNLLEKNWEFCNIEHYYKIKDSIFLLEKRINDFHGRIADLKMYKDADLEEELPDFTTLLGEAFQTQGGKTRDQAKEFNIYYDFKPALNSPLLLSGIYDERTKIVEQNQN